MAKKAKTPGEHLPVNLSSVLLFVVIFLSIIARFWLFWRPSFSGDEADYTRVAVTVLRGAFDLARLHEPNVALQNLFLPFLQHAHGPLEFLVIIPAVLLQPREFFVRLVYVLIGCVVLILSYVKLRKYRGETVALAFLTLFGTSVYVVWWTQTTMYQSLSMAASIAIVLSLIRLEKKVDTKSLVYLSISCVSGLLVFPDMIMFFPTIIWALYTKRKQLPKSFWLICFFTILIPSVYYVPWILYSFVGNPRTGFFNLLQNKLGAHPNSWTNLKEFWHNFFGFPGVFTIWPISLASVFLFKKVSYIKYVFVSIILISIVYIVKSYNPYFYFVSLIGPFAFLSAEVIAASKKWSYPVIIFLLLLHIYFLLPLFAGVHNPLIFGPHTQPDQIKKVGEIAKKCITQDNETYISTEDYGRSFYYFGRPSTVFEDGITNKIRLMEGFVAGKLPQVKLIQYDIHSISAELRSQLQVNAHKTLLFGRHEVVLYKDCEYPQPDSNRRSTP